MFCFCFVFLLYSMLPVSLDCPFVIASSVFSNVYLLSIKETKNILSMILYVFRLIFTRDNISYIGFRQVIRAHITCLCFIFPETKAREIYNTDMLYEPVLPVKSLYNELVILQYHGSILPV